MVSEALRVEKNRPVGYGPPFRVTAGLTRQSDAAQKKPLLTVPPKLARRFGGSCAYW
nr:MAG TPA: hypothetical protein [Caudoviricetes sp.]